MAALPHQHDGLPAVSVVLVTYDSAEVLGAALDALGRLLPDAEVLVVDNGSSDGTVVLARSRPGIRLIEGHGNVGFGAGVNIGVAAASGRIVLVLNPDAVAVAVRLPELLRLGRSGPVGIRGVRFRDGDGDAAALEAAWGWRLELTWAVLQWFVLPREVTARRPRWPRATHRAWVGGAAFVVDRAEFLAVGGFDESFFLYFEDQDLSHRYRAHGLPVLTTEALTVAHSGQHSSPGGSDGIQAFALMSLVELTARQRGAAAGAAAARGVARALRLVPLLGRALGPVPVIGARGRIKARSAEQVRGNIARIVRHPPHPTSYPHARRAFRDALALQDDPPARTMNAPENDRPQAHAGPPAAAVPQLPTDIESRLRCPDTGRPLVFGPSATATADGELVFPHLGGRPAIVPAASRWMLSDATPAAEPRLARWRQRLNRAVSPSLNLASERNFRLLLRQLAARAPGQRADVLVVGGGIVGNGVEVLIDCPDVRLIETDIYPGPRVQLVCDAHALPFADGSFDAVVIQAVLEHVFDPPAVAAEIHRVLAPGGLVYSEIPFLQQVHEGAFDFTRFTELGHRRLFRSFDELATGPVAGPFTALAWSWRYLGRALAPAGSRLVGPLGWLATLLSSWVKHLDRLVIERPAARDAAFGTYFLGVRRETPISDQQIVTSYRGTIGVPRR